MGGPGRLRMKLGLRRGGRLGGGREGGKRSGGELSSFVRLSEAFGILYRQHDGSRVDLDFH